MCSSVILDIGENKTKEPLCQGECLYYKLDEIFIQFVPISLTFIKNPLNFWTISGICGEPLVSGMSGNEPA